MKHPARAPNAAAPGGRCRGADAVGPMPWGPGGPGGPATGHHRQAASPDPHAVARLPARVCIAQALVHQPQLLILDEPGNRLDPRQIIELRQLIRSLAGRYTVLIRGAPPEPGRRHAGLGARGQGVRGGRPWSTHANPK